jgi:hypothetical protein
MTYLAPPSTISANLHSSIPNIVGHKWKLDSHCLAENLGQSAQIARLMPVRMILNKGILMAGMGIEIRAIRYVKWEILD